MGCSTSCTIFESFSHAIHWVLTNKLEVQYMSHILDDFMFIGPANSPLCQKSLNTSLAERVRIPIKASKMHPRMLIAWLADGLNLVSGN